MSAPGGGDAMGGGGAAGGGDAAGGAADAVNPILLNILAAKFLVEAYLWVLVAFTGYNLVSRGANYVRRMATMNSDTQRYFAEPNMISDAKRRLLYAPLIKDRHNRELTVGKLRFGIIPSRVQTLLLLGLVGVNIYLLLRDLTLPLTADGASGLISRAATLAVVNLVPLFFFAGRKNPFIMLTGVDFNNFNTMHRWIARIVVSLIVVHTGTVLITRGMAGGKAAVIKTLYTTEFTRNGFIASLCLIGLVLQAAPYLRKPFYETFLVTHQALAATFLAFALMHTSKYWEYQVVSFIVVIWIVDRAIRFINLLRNNVGKKGTKIMAEVLPGNAMRITIYAARPWNVIPGQHLFLYLPGVSLWQSHPFSIAWSEKQQSYQEPDLYEIEKGGLVTSGQAISTESSMSLIVRKQTGATATLYNKVSKAGGRLSCRALVEGPYGGHHGLDSYGTVLLFAGGVGITHHVPYIRRLVEGFTRGTVSCRKLVMVWSVQSAEHLEWVRPWMTSILGMEGRRDLLRIMIFVTRPDPNNPQSLDVQSPSASVKMFPGRRPDIASIIDSEAVDQIGTMAISVCGAGALSDSVRAEARKRTKTSNIDFFDESFSW